MEMYPLDIQDFNTRLSQEVLIGDGAMGTMLYQRGVFLNACFDELCLTRPDLITEIHTEYVKTGCDFIETNTFGANAVKLAHFGLTDKVNQINKTAAQLARKAAGDSTWVAGSIGPTGANNPHLNTEQHESAALAFTQQAQALASVGNSPLPTSPPA